MSHGLGIKNGKNTPIFECRFHCAAPLLQLDVLTCIYVSRPKMPSRQVQAAVAWCSNNSQSINPARRISGCLTLSCSSLRGQGRLKTAHQVFMMAMAACNLVRMRTLAQVRLGA